MDQIDADTSSLFDIALADYANTIRRRRWTRPDRSSVVHAFGRVIENAHRRLDAAGIDMPRPTQVVLFHDRTEEAEGDRAERPEGGSAGKKAVPRRARIVDATRGRGRDASNA